MPETGTFLSRDPVESEPPYQYVGGTLSVLLIQVVYAHPVYLSVEVLMEDRLISTIDMAIGEIQFLYQA
jgi:hypothetical protein